jgi:hypothetical protein
MHMPSIYAGSTPNPTYHVLVDLQVEGMRYLLGDARAAKARIEALDFEDCSNQFF